MIADDHELSTRLSSGFATCKVRWRICVRSRPAPPTITCSHQVFWPKIDRMQLEVREYLSLHPAI